MNPEFEAVLAAILDLSDRDTLVKAARQAQYLLEIERLNCLPDQQGAIGNHLLLDAPAAKHIQAWRKLLAIQLAGYNGCRVIRGHRPTNSLWIVGRDITVRSVRRLYLPITVKIEGMAQAITPTAQDVPPDSATRRQLIRGWKNKWRMSLIHELDAALADGAKSAQEALHLYPDASLKWEQRTVMRWIKQYLNLVPMRKRPQKIR